MINKDYTYAVVGASTDETKYGHKVFIDLLSNGYKTIPINPKEGKLYGETVYPKLADYDGQIDVAIFVIPPEITKKILKELPPLGIKIAWMQPGSQFKEAPSMCEELGLTCVQACIMINRRSSEMHEALK